LKKISGEEPDKVAAAPAAPKAETDHEKKEKDNLGILANAIFPAEAKKMKPKVDTSKVTQEAVDQMKQMTNPNVKATQVATAPKAVIS
jgi:hypothetical protein